MSREHIFGYIWYIPEPYCVLFLVMQLQGVKNLPKLNQYTEESFQDLEKKQEEYRKYSKGTY